MGFSVKETRSSVEPKDFPKLMINEETGEVVLFQGPGSGVILVTSDKNEHGVFFETFEMEDFSDYYGTITLKND